MGCGRLRNDCDSKIGKICGEEVFPPQTEFLSKPLLLHKMFKGGLFMAEIVFGIILIFPAMLGLAEMLHTFKMHLLSSPKRCERVLVVYPDDENFSRQIMKTAEERK